MDPAGGSTPLQTRVCNGGEPPAGSTDKSPGREFESFLFKPTSIFMQAGPNIKDSNQAAYGHSTVFFSATSPYFLANGSRPCLGPPVVLLVSLTSTETRA